jgi:hypothetical protein
MTNAEFAGRCGTIMPPNYKTWRNNLIPVQNLVTTLKHDTCLNKKFSIVFYVVLDSNYTWGPGFGPGNLTSCVNILNNAFKRICVSFANCSTVVIPNYKYNKWRADVHEPVVTNNWYTDKTINIYCVDSIKVPAGAAGYAYMPGGKDVIVLMKSAVASLVVPVHEMGHFFGLVHTWDEIGSPVVPAPNPPAGSYEYVERTNCYTNGDGFCDTEADCYPAGNNLLFPCSINYGPVDGYGKYYTPPVDNYMTYFTCQCRFSQEQCNFMARVILTQRLYLH